jgi:hypothetical protein
LGARRSVSRERVLVSESNPGRGSGRPIHRRPALEHDSRRSGQTWRTTAKKLCACACVCTDRRVPVVVVDAMRSSGTPPAQAWTESSILPQRQGQASVVARSTPEDTIGAAASDVLSVLTSSSSVLVLQALVWLRRRRVAGRRAHGSVRACELESPEGAGGGEGAACFHGAAWGRPVRLIQWR